jgi:hypothetical protein
MWAHALHGIGVVQKRTTNALSAVQLQHGPVFQPFTTYEVWAVIGRVSTHAVHKQRMIQYSS